MKADFLPAAAPLLRTILWKRGFRSTQEAEQFLHPRLTDLPSPWGQMLDLELAITLLQTARDQKQRVVVFGDFDVDGSTSAALLVSVLREWNFEASYFIPQRMQEGYGVTVEAAQRLLSEVPDAALVITCDCGISSFAGIEVLKAAGCRVIVTDHHEPGEKRVSADAVIDPKQAGCVYPEKRLAGVGVAFVLLVALRRALNLENYKMSAHLDLVALGTVCDRASLVGANRALVRVGLERLAATTRPGLRALMRRVGLEGTRLRSDDLGFLLGPRINAPGRMGPSQLGVQTLLARSEKEAEPWVSELERYNLERRAIQNEQVTWALEEVERQKMGDRSALVLMRAGLHIGVVGLIASKVAEVYKKPVAVLTSVEDEHQLADFPAARGIWKGSLRAPMGYHLAQALHAIREESPEGWIACGGHACAAGVTLRETALEAFATKLEAYLHKNRDTRVDDDVDAVLESLERVEEILPALEPLGEGNPAPLLLVRGLQVQNSDILKEKHRRWEGRILGRSMRVLQFNSPWARLESDRRGGTLDFVGELKENEWQGKVRLEFRAKEILAWNEEEISVGAKQRRTDLNAERDATRSASEFVG